MKSQSQLLLHYISNFEERGLKAAKYSIEKSLQEASKEFGRKELTGQVLVDLTYRMDGGLHRGVN